MSAPARSTPACLTPAAPSRPRAVAFALSDWWVLTQRNLLRYVRIPSLLVLSTIQPIVLVILFSQVFGGALSARLGVDYIDYLLPGIYLQSVLFGTNQTAVGLARDASDGLIDRFRSLPMARSAVLAGRTLSDVGRNLFVVVLMTGVGYLLGFRIATGPGQALAALAVIVLFGFAFSWVMATIGLTIRDVESAQTAGFLWLFPLIFASSVFVPVDTMPDWLRAFAEVSPVSATADAVRALVLGGPAAGPVLASLAWSAGILAVFMPLASWRFRRS
jgi:ABC-2 type transport system permease protein/oleandomycin transport system permease protein